MIRPLSEAPESVQRFAAKLPADWVKEWDDGAGGQRKGLFIWYPQAPACESFVSPDFVESAQEGGWDDALVDELAEYA